MSGDQNLGASLRELTVIEIGDQSGDYCAMMLAGLGAKVTKIEPLEGAPSRRIGPFASSDRDPEGGEPNGAFGPLAEGGSGSPC